MNKFTAWINSKGLSSVLILAVVLLVLFPLAFDIFRLNLVGKYLTYAFVALGLVMLWGYGGVLSLGQGVFFGLGGYAMAMFLKLEASDPASTKIQSTPGIPDFMDWNQLTELPLWWQPFEHLPFAIIAVVAIPTLLAFIIGYAMFKRRVGGVYFAIITQAVALILTVLIIGQQGYTGGVNGMTDLKTLLGWDIRTDGAKYILYYLCALLLLGSIALCLWVQKSKLGTLLLAMRDKEDRVRFSGYDVAMFKVFVFCLAAALSGYRRGTVHATGGLHVAVFRGHRSLDRDGDLRRRGRAHEPGGRGLRRTAGELRQDLLLRELPRPLAVPDGRAVHRRDHGLPRRAGWRVGEESQALVGAQAGRTPGYPRGRSARCCHAGAPH